jgi:hypothetical protein
MFLPAPLTRNPARPPNCPSRDSANLVLASAATLYFELLTIQDLCTEVRVFANLKNLCPWSPVFLA